MNQLPPPRESWQRQVHLSAERHDVGHRVDQITDALKRYILTNRLQPGSRLPTERQLASALVVGRNLVRESLNSLVALGIVEKRHGSGIYVREFNAEGLAEQLSYGLREGMAYWNQLFEARVELEVMLVPLAARRISSQQLAHLRELLETMRRKVEAGESLDEPDLAFHRLLIGAAGNPVLERLTCAVLAEYFRTLGALRLDLALVGDGRTVANHEPLVAAMEARDAQAAVQAMRYHFHSSREAMLSSGPGAGQVEARTTAGV